MSIGGMTILRNARVATATQAARERTVTKTDLSMRYSAVGARGRIRNQIT